MDRLVERLPSPGGAALWLYALAFFIVPALLAYKGFAYVLGIVIFAVGVRPYIEDMVAGHPLRFALNWRGRKRTWELHVAAPTERFAVRMISIGLILGTMLAVPVLVFVIQQQAVQFYQQITVQMPAILGALKVAVEWAHEQLPGFVPDVSVSEGAGWEGLTSAVSEILGDAIKDVKKLVQGFFGSVLGVIGGILGNWIKLVIAAIIIGTILSGWKKEVAMHRSIVAGGIKHPGLRRNVLRYGELFQSGVSLFMIGYLEVALTISFLFCIALVVMPFGLSLGAILFISVMMGFITAVPKIGGLVGMALGAVLMLTNIAPGLGWFGFKVMSFGIIFDVLIRTTMMLVLAKLLGLLEAYNYTPEIIGQRLGLTKMQIIATIIVWAVGAGFFGMIWGVLLSLSFQAALRLSQEVAEEEKAAEKAPEKATSK